MPTSRRPVKPLIRALGSLAALTLTLVASFVGPLATRAEPLPSLPVPSIPIPSIPLPSLSNQPSVSILPSLPVPSLPIPSIPLPSLSTQPSSSPNGSAQSSPSGSGSSSHSAPPSADPASGGDVDASVDANVLLTGASPSSGAQPPPGGAGGGPFGGIGLPQMIGAGSAALLVGLLALYLAAGAGWLAVVRRKLGGIGLRVTAWREERLGGNHPDA